MLENFLIIVTILFHLQTKTQAVENIKLVVEKMINVSIKTSVPCEDFYSYACGDYNVDNFNYINHQYNVKIFDLLRTYNQEKRQVPEGCSTFVQKMRKYYASCAKIAKRNLTNYLKEIKPGSGLNWPILEEQKNQKKWPYGKDFDVWTVLGKFQSHGLGNLIIELEIKSSTEYSIILKPCKSIFNTTLPFITDWENLQIGVSNQTEIVEHIKETDELLMNILNKFNKTDQELEQTSLDNIIMSYPNINFKSFLNESLGQQLPLGTSIVLRNPHFFKYLNDNLWLAFNKPKLCNYLMIKFLQFVAYDVTEEFADAPCIEELRKKFDLAVNFLYYYNSFALVEDFVKPDVTEIFEAEIDMLEKHFKSNRHKFEKSEVEFLIEKLSAIQLNIGNLPTNVRCQKVEEFYSSVPTLDEHNYYKNHLLMLRFTKSLNLLKNESFFIVSNFKMKSLSKVFYAPNQNAIILPFTHLMTPIYDLNGDNFTKYALLGFNLANELAQAFDFNNLMLDFAHKGACLTKNFHFENSLKCLQSQPVFRFTNSMADNVAIDIVKKIVTLKFINDQDVELRPFWKKYFYLTLAQNFCKNPFNVYMERDRLNQIVMNSYGFSQAFHCPESSKMNPLEQCEVY